MSENLSLQQCIVSHKHMIEVLLTSAASLETTDARLMDRKGLNAYLRGLARVHRNLVETLREHTAAAEALDAAQEETRSQIAKINAMQAEFVAWQKTIQPAVILDNQQP